MWVMGTEPLHIDGVWCILLSYGSETKYEDPDEIICFGSLEDCLEFDMDDWLEDFNWEKYF